MGWSADFMWGDTEDEAARVAYYVNLFNQVRIRRVNFETQWEEAAALCWPEYQNTFTYGHTHYPGLKRTQFQIDSAGAIASHRFGVIYNALATPAHMRWSLVQASDPKLRQAPRVRQYFEAVNNKLWQERYDQTANFTDCQMRNGQVLGVFGNMYMLNNCSVGPHGKKLVYQAPSVGEIYLLLDQFGRVNGYIRHFRRDARQAHYMWGQKKGKDNPDFPPVLQAALVQNSKTFYNFFEIVHPRTDWQPWEVLTAKGFPYCSCYLSVEGHCILEEGGYRTFPLAAGRYMVAPEEDYGRGPAQMVLPALKTLNSIKKDYLEQAHLAVKPAYLIGDDGLMDPKTHAGAFNYGGMTADGRPLVGMMPQGQIQAGVDAMDREGAFVQDAFLVSLFQTLFVDAKTGRQTFDSARAVVEYAAERGIFLAPTIGATNGPYLGTLIDRELDNLSYLGQLPPMPPELREAQGEYHLEYTSPIARAVRTEEIAGAMQTVEFASTVVQAGGDPSILDNFEWDVMLREVGDVRMVPDRWFANAQSMAQKRQARSQQAEREQQAKELPGKAAIMKAQAITAKAQTGGNTGGTLSGTPSGGMPQMPGRPGMPGAPGVGGGPGRPGVPGVPGGY